MFHELFAGGSKRLKHRVVELLQQLVVRLIAGHSHGIRTNRSESRTWLAGATSHARESIRCLPVFSNLGEITAPAPASVRPKELLLFQPPPWGSPEGAAFWAAWERIRSLHPEMVTKVGGRARVLPDDPSLVILGVLSREAASQCLARASLALFEYFDGYLGKSGLFAAMAAHGVPVVLARANHSEADGLFPGRHFLTGEALTHPLEAAVLDGLGATLHEWYRSHSVKATAADYFSQMGRL